jgi:hypothetical protein
MCFSSFTALPSTASRPLVFYTPRFFLYLVPFYLIGAALAFFPRVARVPRLRRWLSVAGALAILASAVVAVRETAALLRDPPRELLEAGSILRAVSRPGDRVIARKPQIAYFAHMTYEPIPQVETLRQLLHAARGAQARYLNLSGIEAALRPQFRLLTEADLHLPGFTLLARQMSDPDHYFALYRIEPPGPADAAFVDSLLSALRALGARNAQVQAYAGRCCSTKARPQRRWPISTEPSRSLPSRCSRGPPARRPCSTWGGWRQPRRLVSW